MSSFQVIKPDTKDVEKAVTEALQAIGVECSFECIILLKDARLMRCQGTNPETETVVSGTRFTHNKR